MHTSEVLPLTVKMGSMALVPLIVVLIPIVGALIVALLHKRPKVRNAVAITANAAAFALLVYIYKPVVTGITVGGHLYRGIEYSLPNLFGVGLNFRVDTVGLLIALVTSFIYTLSCIYATSYMAHEHAQTRYFSFVLLTLSANLGVLLVKDFFSLFIFFELMAIFSYVLVIHEEDTKAMEAGKLYIYMCIVGGLALLVGIILLYFFTGTANMVPMAALIEKTMPHLKYTVAFLMIIGFGSKAGIFFLHIWLPEAHPIAPTPASALLSGLMIKVGAYGIIRTVNTLWAPGAETVAEGAAHAAKHMPMTTLNNLGYALIWVGVITMFFGVVNALLSANCKRMLAYHSVSQMGFIVMGIGCAAYLGKDGAMGLAGALYHIVNHAIFKAALFLSIGAVYLRTRELDMYKLGGLWRNMPFTCIACFVAVMGIAGVPLFNGFASKTLLHHAINEAYQGSALYSNGGKQLLALRIAEVIFMLTCFGTFCSNVKMWLFVFIWKRPQRFKDVKPEPVSMKIALGSLMAAIMFIGLRPNWLIEKFIGPSLAYFGYESTSHAYHILFNVHAPAGAISSTIPLLYDPKTLSIFGSPDALHNIIGCATAVLGGGMVFILGYRFGWFHAHPPAWISVKYWYEKAARIFLIIVPVPLKIFNTACDRVIMAVTVDVWQPKILTSDPRNIALNLLDKATLTLQRITLFIRKLNNDLDKIITLGMVDIWVFRMGIGASSAELVKEMPLQPALSAAGPETFFLEEFETIQTNNTLEKLSHTFNTICNDLRAINNFWDRMVTRAVLDTWLAESLESFALSSGDESIIQNRSGKIKDEDFEQLDTLHQFYKDLRSLKFTEFCKFVGAVDKRWDKLLTKAVLDAWIAGDIPSADDVGGVHKEVKSQESLASVYKELKNIKFKDFISWIRNFNNRLDKVISTAAVDTWIAEHPESLVGKPKEIQLTLDQIGKPGSPEPKTVELFESLKYEIRNFKSSEFADRLREINNRLDKIMVDSGLEEPAEPKNEDIDLSKNDGKKTSALN